MTCTYICVSAWVFGLEKEIGVDGMKRRNGCGEGRWWTSGEGKIWCMAPMVTFPQLGGGGVG